MLYTVHGPIPYEPGMPTVKDLLEGMGYNAKTFAQAGPYLLMGSSGGVWVINLNAMQPIGPRTREWVRRAGPRGIEPYQRAAFERIRLAGFIQTGRVYALLSDTINDRVVAALATGLVVYSGADSTVVLDSLGTPLQAKTLTLRPDGKVWVGTPNHGLCLLEGNRITRYVSTASSNLLSNHIRCLFQQNDTLWVGTNLGLQRLDSEGKVLDTFTREDGLPAREVMNVAVWDGCVWVGTLNGLAFFPTTLSGINPQAPNVFLTSARTLGGSVLENASIETTWNDNTLVAAFQGVGLRAGASLQFKYRLLGLSEDWVPLGTQRTLTLQNLPPGSYTLEIVALNEDGVQSLKPARMSVVVRPALWQRAWFWVAIFIVLATGTGVGFRARMLALRRRAGIEQALRTSQLQALRAQMNPHFIFNALNSIQEFILLENKRQATAYLGKFAELVRLNLDASASQWVKIEDEERMLRLYLELEKMRFEDKLDYELVFAPGTPQAGYSVPSMVIQPFVENALKHGLLHKATDRQLQVVFSSAPTLPHTLLCTIDDNGIGREASAEINIRSACHPATASFAERNTRLPNWLANSRQIFRCRRASRHAR
jgi:hypothetical protein